MNNTKQDNKEILDVLEDKHEIVLGKCHTSNCKDCLKKIYKENKK